MKPLECEFIESIGGGLDARLYDTQVAPEPTPDPNVTIDYNPEQPPQ